MLLIAVEAGIEGGVDGGRVEVGGEVNWWGVGVSSCEVFEVVVVVVVDEKAGSVSPLSGMT